MTTTTIRKILGDRPLFSIAPDAPLSDAARLMADHGLGALAVLDAGHLVGILSERDIVYRAVAHDLPTATTPVRAVMTPDPVVLGIDEPISSALAARLGKTFRHLPVLDGTRVAGLLSYRDIPAEYAMLFERFNEMKAAHAND